MALLDGVGEKKEGGSSFANLVRPESGLNICRISPEKGETIIRIIPERHADGTLRPMLNGMIGGSNDWSNLSVISVTTNAGERGDKMTVINEPSDSIGGAAPNWPLSGLYIRLKNMEKTNKLPPHLEKKITELMKGDPKRNFGAALSRPQDTVAVQAIVKVLNGKVLPKAVPKQIVLMSAESGKSLGRALNAALAAGQDLFGPYGHWIRFKPEVQRATEMTLATAEVADACPAPEAMLKPMWVPWDAVWVRRTKRELLQGIIKAFGREVVQVAFPEDVEELMAEKALEQGPRTTVAVAPTSPPAGPIVVPQPLGLMPEKAASTSLMDMMATETVDLGAGDKNVAPPAAPPAATAPVKPPNAQEAYNKYKELLEQGPGLGDLQT